MRSMLIFGLVSTLAVAPAVQAQQVAAPASAERPTPHLVEVPMPRMQVEVPTAPATVVLSSQETAAADVRRETSARTLLAVIGGILVVVALVALAR